MFPRDSVTVIDGGLSTALESIGLGESIKSRLWTGLLLRSADGQAKIREVHRLYAEAGAGVVITSSYQISYRGCEEQGWDRAEVDSALHYSTELAKGFEGVKVAASVGPYGAALADGSEYRGNYGLSKDELKSFHRERLRRLMSTGPDLLAIETIPEVSEALAVIELIREISSERESQDNIAFWISFSCRNESQISSGEPFAEAVAAVLSKSEKEGLNLVAIGINCTAPTFVSPLLQSCLLRSSMETFTSLSTNLVPFVVYPNSGRAWDAENKTWLGEGCGDRSLCCFEAEQVKQWIALGVRILGGCCGCGPSDIACLKRLVTSIDIKGSTS